MVRPAVGRRPRRAQSDRVGVHERDDGLVDLKRRAPAAPMPEPRLLGSFKPILLGWKSRGLLLRRPSRSR